MTSNHLQIYNPQPDTSSSFPQFARLPQELRLYIWSLCLRTERFVRAQLEAPSDDSDQPFTLLVKEAKFLNKLFHVNVEARQVAHEFYRVQLPCVYHDGTKKHDATFYLHPELDILWLGPGRYAHKHFITLLAQLRESDPQKVGLQNLAMRGNDINALDDIAVPRLSSEEHETLKSTLSSLKNVYYLSIENAGRVHMGYFGGIPDIKQYEVHRSKPVMGRIPSFTRLASDPRPNIDYDLSKVFVGTFDPRRMVFHFRKLLQKWGVPKCKTRHHFLLANSEQYRGRIADRKSAERWLKAEDESWLGGQERFKKLIEKGERKVPIETEEELQAAPRTAVGFWVFPVSALGKYPKMDVEYQYDAGYWKAKRVLDLREYRPQLCLAHLP